MSRAELIGYGIGLICTEFLSMAAVPALAWACGAEPLRAFVYWNLFGLLTLRVGARWLIKVLE